MLTVSRLAKLTEVSPHTIRHYVKIGLLQPTRDESNNYQVFSREDVNYLRFIQKAKLLGFTLKDIQQVLHDAKQGTSPCPKVRKILQLRIKEIHLKIQELMELQASMQQALDQWQSLPNGNPTGESICSLIEATAKI